MLSRRAVTMQALPGEKLDHAAIHGAWDFKGFRTGDTLVNKGKNSEKGRMVKREEW